MKPDSYQYSGAVQLIEPQNDATMNADGRSRHRNFTGTSWTLLEQAVTDRGAQNEFARRYRRPVLGYFRALTRDVGEAERLTQDFFAALIETGNVIRQADRNRGPFRTYLKTVLRNFWKNDLVFRQRQKREPQEMLHPDAWPDAGWETLQLQGGESPEVAYHNGWVHALLDAALIRVKLVCEQRGQKEHYDLFMGRYLCSGSAPSWGELGAPFGLEEKTARARTETVVRHLRVILRQMLCNDLGADGPIDAELSELLNQLT